MAIILPIAIGAGLFALPALIPAPKNNQKKDGASNGDDVLIAENDINEKESGQRNFGDNYKEQELYYASEQYKKTLEPYQKSSSGNKVNSDQASNNAAIANKLTE